MESQDPTVESLSINLHCDIEDTARHFVDKKNPLVLMTVYVVRTMKEFVDQAAVIQDTNLVMDI